MAKDEYGGYYWNSNPNPRWGQGQQFASQQACYNSCVSSGDAGCGVCSYMEPPATIIQKLEASSQTPPHTTTLSKGIESQKQDDVLKYIILAGIALIILSWS